MTSAFVRLARNRVFRLNDKLRQPVMVAQVNEQKPPMVAFPVNPARQADSLVNIAAAQSAASVASIFMHGIYPLGTLAPKHNALPALSSIHQSKEEQRQSCRRQNAPYSL